MFCQFCEIFVGASIEMLAPAVLCDDCKKGQLQSIRARMDLDE